VPKESCLHCQLVKVIEKWRKSHNASKDEFLSMIARAAGEAAGMLPECQDIEGIEVVILGFRHVHTKESLH
jgi:hypothetical protein